MGSIKCSTIHLTGVPGEQKKIGFKTYLRKQSPRIFPSVIETQFRYPRSLVCPQQDKYEENPTRHITVKGLCTKYKEEITTNAGVSGKRHIPNKEINKNDA